MKIIVFKIMKLGKKKKKKYTNLSRLFNFFTTRVLCANLLPSFELQPIDFLLTWSQVILPGMLPASKIFHGEGASWRSLMNRLN